MAKNKCIKCNASFYFLPLLLFFFSLIWYFNFNDNRFTFFFFLGTIATIIYTKIMAYCISSPWFYHVQDPRALTCCGRNDEFWKQHPMVDDHVLDIVKIVGLEGLHRTPSREIDHNLIMAFVEQWRPETQTFHLPHGETMITLQDVEVLWGFQSMVRQLLDQLTWSRLMNVKICLKLLLMVWCYKAKGSRLNGYFKKLTKGCLMVQQRLLCINMQGVIF